MAKFITPAIDFNSIEASEYPMADTFIFGLDHIDGLMKKMDFEGVVTPVFSSNMCLNNCLFVDSENGNDSLAEPFIMDKSYATITAAQTNAVSGNTIIIFPGTYSDNNLGKEGVNYYFYPGAKVFSSTQCFTDNGASINFNVLGYGEFTSPGTVLKMWGITTNINFDAFKVVGSAANSRCFWIDGGGGMLNAYVQDSIHSGNGSDGESALRLKTHASLNPTMIVRTNKLTSDTQVFQTTGGNSNGKIIVFANTISISLSGNNYALSTQEGGEIKVYGNINILTDSSYGIPMFSGSGVFKIYGDVNITSSLCINISDGIYEFNGKVTTTGTIINNGAVVKFNKELITDNGQESILHNAGKTIVSNLVKNLSDVSIAHGIKVVASGVLLKSGTVIYITNADAESVTSSTVQEIVTYLGVVTNKAVNANIDALIGGITINAAVDSE